MHVSQGLNPFKHDVFQLSITQSHIDSGVRCNRRTCAAALALLEHFPDCLVTVDEASGLVEKEGHAASLVFGPLVKGFIADLDDELWVGPTTVAIGMVPIGEKA